MAILKKKDIPPMKPEVKQTVSAASKKHRFFLLLHHLGNAAMTFAIRGFIPSYVKEAKTTTEEDIQDALYLPRVIIAVAIRIVILFFVFLAVWAEKEKFFPTILMTAVNYIVLHVLFLIPGLALHVLSGNLLTSLRSQIQAYKEQYLADLLSEKGIENNEIRYDDGVTICLNDIKIESFFNDPDNQKYETYRSVYFDSEEPEKEINAPTIFKDYIHATSATLKMPAPYTENPFTVYCVQQQAGSDAFFAWKDSPRECDLMLEKGISSIGFNDRFRIVVHHMEELQNIRTKSAAEQNHLKNKAEVKAIQMIPATLQIDMIRNELYEKLSTIEVASFGFVAESVYQIKKATDLDLFKRKSLLSYFREVDVYCKQIHEMCESLHSQATKTWFYNN